MGRLKNGGSRSLALGLRDHLVILAVMTGVLFLMVYLFSRGVVGLFSLYLFLVLGGGSFSACLFSIVVHIYKPIKKVEEATAILSKRDIFRTLELESDNAALSMHFHELMQLLRESINREYTADILKKEAELKALQSQINPHFLYNVLDGIRGHALTEGVTELAEMTEALSKIFRYSVSHWENEVTLERELTNVRNYFKIQQYRFNNKFELEVLIQGNEDKTLACKIPKLTLQPIIENAIYHGLEMKLDKGLVTIRTRLTEKILLIEVSDDGIGVSQNVLDEVNNSFQDWKTVRTEKERNNGGGIALANVNSRIKMMYGEEYGLYMYSTQGFGAMVEIMIPAEND